LESHHQAIEEGHRNQRKLPFSNDRPHQRVLAHSALLSEVPRSPQSVDVVPGLLTTGQMAVVLRT
jgi:hypothetical protein